MAGPRLNAGVCLMQLQQPAEAARWFARATHADSQSFEAWANLAVARNAAGDRAGALSAVDRALALSPANARLAGLRDSLRRGAPAQ
jgi:Tfp pilus assembly protein PilF